MTELPDTIRELAAELVGILGERGVSTELRAREKASADGSYLSPIITEQLPLGLADIVAFPTTAQQIAETVAAAVRHGVGITPRGKGTGNYGQAIPLENGLVLDLSKARGVVDVGDGHLTALAGTPIVTIEQAAHEAGQQILMYPSTAQSSIGGFLSGGSGGTGSIAHGSNHQGFVLALDVVHAVPDATLVHVEGDDAQPYVHTYGTAGIIAQATIALEPLQEWRGLFASFDDFGTAISVLREIGRLEPTPRLVSADLPVLANALPADPGIPKDRSSLRAIIDVAAVAAASELIEQAGGRVEDVRDGAQTAMKLSMISYNHPIEWLQKSDPGKYFHIEVAGDALVDRIDEVHAVYPGGMLHIEAQKDRPIGMLAGIYSSAQEVYEGFAKLAAIGVGVHNPHVWFVDHEVERTLALSESTDPAGLLNPGKLQGKRPAAVSA
ncbi:FAD-binding oxidoreductase [Agreia sp. COWG]|uniref:FAD-binding oxidoreductase n=1 Tax=Agreia sp. COWG TaxID=2773266 RepID=UPI001928B6DF|nr:FAD-binding oxidoreductase [Agreia sp. COWG]CAD5995052.1 FAD/FMN-containing dehydrogenase [Agreia sp. COWG]